MIGAEFFRSLSLVEDLEHPDRFGHYRPTRRALPIITAIIEPGTTTMVIAPYGSGKSLAAGVGALAVFNSDDDRRALAAVLERIDQVDPAVGAALRILVTNLMLDLCALNSPEELEMHLIDPKRGVDYAWARRLPHLKGGIIDDQDEAMALLERLVGDMDRRYDEIGRENCRNIDQYNRKMPPGRRMPRIVIFFDEVANWMQDDDFKKVVDGLINKIATKSRAAGFHLFMVYQRADNQVMTMQLRTNLGNKLILRLGDEGSSRIALGEAGADRLLGKGHLIAKLDTDDKIYLQVPFIGEDEVEKLADAVIATWLEARRGAAE